GHRPIDGRLGGLGNVDGPASDYRLDHIGGGVGGNDDEVAGYLRRELGGVAQSRRVGADEAAGGGGQLLPTLEMDRPGEEQGREQRQREDRPGTTGLSEQPAGEAHDQGDG